MFALATNDRATRRPGDRATGRPGGLDDWATGQELEIKKETFAATAFYLHDRPYGGWFGSFRINFFLLPAKFRIRVRLLPCSPSSPLMQYPNVQCKKMWGWLPSPLPPPSRSGMGADLNLSYLKSHKNLKP